jgi:predicted nucleotidyltransferase
MCEKIDVEGALAIAREYVDSVGKVFSVKQAFLFGSYAKGNNHEDSDIDVALIIDEVEDLLEAQLAMFKLRRSIDTRLEPHPFHKEDFNASNPVAFEVMKYGIEIKVNAVVA